jgi:hypothetical protein
MLHGQKQTSVHQGFFPLLKLSVFQDLTHLGGGPKTTSGKESFSLNYKGALAQALPSVTQRLEMQLLDLP